MITHRLNVDLLFCPIKQKRRKLGTDRNNAVNKEVKRLLENRMVQEVQYPKWLVNLVIVPKKNGKTRVCIDLTDLNKTCL